MKKKEKSAAQNFYESLRNDPEGIIKWCEGEIEAYKELIRLVKGK